MEHSCRQCGNTVEDGRPFCPQCRAPQISVKIAIPDAEIAHGLSSQPDQFPSDVCVETRLGSSEARHAVPGSMDRAAAARSALKAGVLGALIAVLIPAVGIVLAGALAVFFYRRENGFVLPVRLGSRLGGAAGVVAFAIFSTFLTSLIFVTHSQQKYMDDVMTTAKRFGANSSDPNFQAGFHSLFTPAGMALAFIFGMMFAVLLAAIGGALASLWMRSRTPRA